MSIVGSDREGRYSLNDDRRLLAISIWFFLTVLVSSVWPDPALVLNDLFFDAPIAVDEHAFFGREPFQWDVMMWFLLGLPFIAALHDRTARAGETFRDFRSGLQGWRGRVAERVRSVGVPKLSAIIFLGCCLMAVLWLFVDGAIVEWLSSVPESMSNVATRPLNRMGDGLLLTVCVLFIGVAGAAFGKLSWVREAFALLVTSATAGIVMSTLKELVGRVRPELWTSPADFVSGSESFPSGHSLYAASFAVTLLLARAHGWSRWLLAAFVALIPLARIINFRHWPSDVIASVLLVCLVAWIIVPPTMANTRPDCGA